MCLAVPVKIIAIDDGNATIEVGALKQSCYLGLVPEASVGDYVLVHAGYAIAIIDEEEALKTLELFQQLAEIQNKENEIR